LEAREESVRRAERNLADRQEALQTREETLRDQRGQADHMRDAAQSEIDRLRAELQAEQSAWLQDEERKLAERRQQQDAEYEQRVAELNAQIEADSEQRLAALQEDLTTQQRELDERESAIRQQEEALQVRRERSEEEFAKWLAKLKQQQEGLRQSAARLSAERDAWLAQQQSAPAAAKPTHVRRRWGLTLVASLLVAAAAGWLSYELWPKRYRATDTLSIETKAFPASRALGEHLSAMLENNRADELAQGLGVNPDELIVTGQIIPEQSAIRLTAESSSGWVSASAVKRLLQDYAQQVNEQAELTTPSQQGERLAAQRAELMTQRQALLEQIEPVQAEATVSAADEELAALTEEADSLRHRHADLNKRQAELEARLNALEQNGSAARGTVDAHALAQEEADDRELQQDLDHWRMHRRTFREELITAVQSALPELKALDEALEGLDKAVSRRADENPPADVEEVLSAVAQSRADMSAVYEPFASTWREILAATQDVTDNPDEQDVLALQAQADLQLRDYLEQSGPMLTALQKHLQTLSQPGPERALRTATQNAIATAVSGLVAAQAEFAMAGARVALRSNLRLDAASKTIRGLSHRIADRRAQIESRLQAEADQLSAETHQVRVHEARAELATARDQAQSALADYWAIKEELDAARQAAAEQRNKEQHLELCRVQLARVEEQLVSVNEKVRRLPLESPEPDTAEYVGRAVSTPYLLGESRLHLGMLTAAALAFAACWLGSGLAFGRARRSSA
jgi:hypothetical protein